MTREDAIKILKAIRVYECYPKSASEETKEAIDMAIEALKENNRSDSLVTDSSDECKEQKSKLESAGDTFCKSQLITCNRVKECNGVCPFEDALQHADKTQTMDEQHTINHDREWIIGCIEHDGFIHTHRFDKANQIIHEELSAEPKTGEWIQKDMYADRFCSECNYAVWDSEAEEYNFCPNCGARMIGE